MKLEGEHVHVQNLFLDKQKPDILLQQTAMPTLNIFSRKKQKDQISRSRSRSPATPTVSESSANTPSIVQQIGTVPSIDAQQTAQVPPHLSALDRTNDRTEKYGLFPLHPPILTPSDVEDGETNSLDIVAVHGITGDAYATWTHDNGNFWLRDLVPKDLPGVRVFSYGYPAEVFCTFNAGNLDTYARSLLEGLKRERRKKEVRVNSNLRMKFNATE